MLSLLPFVLGSGMASRIRPFTIVGHRGAPLLVPPGNTAESLHRAVAVGAAMLEVDVRRTRDDVLVLDHDNVHLIDGVEVPIRERAFAEWQARLGENGTPLATLEEAFAIASQARVGLMLDFKEPGTEAGIARAIRQSGFPLDSLLVAGADETSRKILRGLDPRIPLSLTLDVDQAGLVNAKLLAELDTDAVTWNHKLLKPPIVDVLHRRGLLVYAWTVDLAEDMRKMLQVCRVDGVISNAPDLLVQVATSAGS